ncbi:MAG: tRNA (N(6)-L-threonylcarbamoyladenosine(37)-C(2))-methylthiotransferase MtaB [Mycoplasma sp.]
MNTFAIITLGCKVNTYESQVICNELKSHGLIEVDFNAIADIYIINTCSVTNTADLKSRNMIRRAKKNNVNAIIIVAGCYSQTSSKEISSTMEVDIIIGNKYKNNIYSLIQEYQTNQKQIIKVDNLLIEKKFEELEHDSHSDRARAFVKIQDGCNFMCSYCSIPFTRGKQRSSPLKTIVDQIQKLVAIGYQEIVLTGVNTAGYESNGDNFLDLLKAIKDLKGDFRVRISSVEPFQITDEIIELITMNQNRFCNHWHLCLQSGSNTILEKMNRKYTNEEFLSIMNKIRLRSPLSCISTDLIIGFPTETDTEHQESMNFLIDSEMSFCHIFTYSKRKNTPASLLSEVNGTVKKQRFKEAETINKLNFKKYMSKFIDKNIQVIFEEKSNGVYSGKTSEYIKVLLKSEKVFEIGKIYELQVWKIIGDALICKE